MVNCYRNTAGREPAGASIWDGNRTGAACQLIDGELIATILLKSPYCYVGVSDDGPAIGPRSRERSAADP
jgi:hypothetical protein